jgi:hypothetical protein
VPLNTLPAAQVVAAAATVALSSSFPQEFKRAAEAMIIANKNNL